MSHNLTYFEVIFTASYGFSVPSKGTSALLPNSLASGIISVCLHLPMVLTKLSKLQALRSSKSALLPKPLRLPLMESVSVADPN
jgi:hypothetical protein